MKLAEMKRLLAEQGIQLTKSLGQNFLHDANQLRRIIAAAELKPADKVLEIGPGLGVLTEFLLAKAGEVLAIEKDHRLVQCLKSKIQSLEPGVQGPKSKVQSAEPEAQRPSASIIHSSIDPSIHQSTGRPARLRLIHADALEFLRREQRDWREW